MGGDHNISDQCNTIDICCRYGFEEFAVIMPELELFQAVKIAERLRKAVEDFIFVVSGTKLERRMTTSRGVARAADDDCGLEELVKKADDALYCSKRNGRNRVSPATAANS